jgi:hypothetical protein
LTATIALTVTPESSFAEAVPSPPLSTPARAPTPAPTVPTATSATRGLRGPVTELGGRPARPGADRKVEDHRGWNDRHHTAVHLHAATLLLEPGHHAVGGGQAGMRCR